MFSYTTVCELYLISVGIQLSEFGKPQLESTRKACFILAES